MNVPHFICFEVGGYGHYFGLSLLQTVSLKNTGMITLSSVQMLGDRRKGIKVGNNNNNNNNKKPHSNVSEISRLDMKSITHLLTVH